MPGLKRAIEIWKEESSNYKSYYDDIVEGYIDPRIEVVVPIEVKPFAYYPQIEDRKILKEAIVKKIRARKIKSLYKIANDFKLPHSINPAWEWFLRPLIKEFGEVRGCPEAEGFLGSQAVLHSLVAISSTYFPLIGIPFDLAMLSNAIKEKDFLSALISGLGLACGTAQVSIDLKNIKTAKSPNGKLEDTIIEMKDGSTHKASDVANDIKKNWRFRPDDSAGSLKSLNIPFRITKKAFVKCIRYMQEIPTNWGGSAYEIFNKFRQRHYIRSLKPNNLEAAIRKFARDISREMTQENLEAVVKAIQDRTVAQALEDASKHKGSLVDIDYGTIEKYNAALGQEMFRIFNEIRDILYKNKSRHNIDPKHYQFPNVNPRALLQRIRKELNLKQSDPIPTEFYDGNGRLIGDWKKLDKILEKAKESGSNKRVRVQVKPRVDEFGEGSIAKIRERQLVESTPFDDTLFHKHVSDINVKPRYKRPIRNNKAVSDIISKYKEKAKALFDYYTVEFKHSYNKGDMAVPGAHHTIDEWYALPYNTKSMGSYTSAAYMKVLQNIGKGILTAEDIFMAREAISKGEEWFRHILKELRQARNFSTKKLSDGQLSDFINEMYAILENISKSDAPFIKIK